MKPALLIILLSSVFAGHYLVHAQNRLLNAGPQKVLFGEIELEELDKLAHEEYSQSKNVPVMGQDAIRNYDETREALRQQLVAECAPLDSEIVVRVELDNKGRIKRHHMPQNVEQPDDHFSNIFEGISLKKAVIKGLELLDLRFKF